MKIKTVLFDLDGTLLPMDQDAFTTGYFKFLAAKAAPRGYQPRALVDAIWAGTAAMVKNDGKSTNEDAFWKKFSEIFGEAALDDKPMFEEFYRVEFQQAQAFCGYNPLAAETVRWLKGQGLRVALATNPIFPAVATESRIRWAGLQRSDFEIITTYENTCFSKPNLNYYRDVLQRLSARPEECLMVGNDVAEDMVARELGLKVFLLTDCMINQYNQDISVYPRGSFPELRRYIEEELQ